MATKKHETASIGRATRIIALYQFVIEVIFCREGDRDRFSVSNAPAWRRWGGGAW